MTAAVLGATAASAQNFEQYGSEAGWNIAIKEDMGPGCLMMKTNEDGTQIQMGIDATGELKGYMALYMKTPANLAKGDDFEVLFDVDGDQFEGEAIGQEIEGYKGAYVLVNNPDFIYDLAKKKQLTITPKGHRQVLVNLDGTNAAFETLRACQDAQAQ
ncbi:hypothetical protein [Mesorhizobium xinjiangense]|uniref:hypothetical protein n=1 Tax=Mesorhizobium xinjiangense TaxID=2678685 RepID=UPI001F3414A9|nr:hypothetical protein [Mesorhizobium xinjiangense]